MLRGAHGPLTVQEILDRAVAAAPGLGIATVYRTIRLLEAEALIRGVLLSDGQPRYERSDLDEHLHFHCRVCDRVYDMPSPTAGGLPPLPAPTDLPTGFRVDRRELNLYGVCSDCDDEEEDLPAAGAGESTGGNAASEPPAPDLSAT